MNRQDPWVSQTNRRRVVIEGQLSTGGPCTVLFEEHPDVWLLWPFGFDQGPVHLAKDAVRRAAQQLLGGQS